MEIHDQILYLALAAVFGIIGKIVFDWLAVRRENGKQNEMLFILREMNQRQKEMYAILERMEGRFR